MADLDAPDIPRLEPYQEEGALFLARRRFAYLGDEMRLGKTPQSIAALDHTAASTVIIVTVAVGVFNWEAQIRRWSVIDRDIHVVTSGGQATPQSGVIILSFDQAKRHGPSLPRCDVLIVDEAHFAKSVDAGRSAALLGKSGLIRKAARTWFLSGTPSPNGDPRELWTILFTCGVTPLNYEQFQARYCRGSNGPYGFQLRGLQNVAEFQQLLQPFMLRRMWKDVMSQLPELTFENFRVEASPVDLELWFPEYVVRETPADLDAKLATQRAALSAVQEVARDSRASGRTFTGGLEQLGQALATLRRYTALQKCPAIADLVSKELESGVYEKLVIFCVHRDPIEYLRRALAKYKPVTLYGGTALETRAKNLEKFHTHPKCRVFIGQIVASGTNVDLSCASDILMVEQDWTPGNNAQAVMRCHNIKQAKNVHVRIVGLASDIDEKVQMTIRRKVEQLATMYAKD